MFRLLIRWVLAKVCNRPISVRRLVSKLVRLVPLCGLALIGALLQTQPGVAPVVAMPPSLVTVRLRWSILKVKPFLGSLDSDRLWPLSKCTGKLGL